MMKQILLPLLLLFAMATVNVSCSSNKAEDETKTEAGEQGATEDGADDEFEADEELVDDEGEELADGEGEEDGEELADEGGDDLESDLGDDEEGDETLADEETPSDEEGSEGEIAENDEALSDETTAEEPQDEVAESSEAIEPMDESMAENSGTESSFDENSESSEEPSEKPTWIPVKKIADAPFSKRGILVNSVYLARPGDDIQTISSKLFGADKTEDILKVNPGLSRGVKTGDKIYYNSQNRPSDDTILKTYYEDVGLSSEVYVSKAGDNIRKVSMSLLGDENSWKEVWATNLNVESKGEIEEGTQLRYWASTDAMPNMAMNNEPEMPPTPEPLAPPQQAMNEMPPPPAPPADLPPPPPAPPQQAMNDLPPPPPPAPPEAVSAGSLEPPPPPPAPPKRKRRAKKKKKAVAMSDDKDNLMYIALGGLFLLAGIVIYARKRKSKSSTMDFNTHTQIE
ncbi:MAG: hypothetical protein HOO06_01000 [Bdellovibrionaceae bacterium]|jgi:hypothetical protein|nr:hypothetical protein [Pseudobdellovibrionaceae bacterium]